MAGRRLSLPQLVPALMVLVLAVFALATAPVHAARALPQSSEMVTGSGSPCTDMAEGAGHSQGKHADRCLAACLSTHGAVLPDMAMPGADLRLPAMIAETKPVKELADHPFGIDPPPPRAA